MAERIRTDNIKFDEHKLEQLILYFAVKCKDDPKFGSTKLNKMLYAADFLAYANLGKPITGATYQHLERGPAPRELLPTRKQMEQDNYLKMELTDYHGKSQQRPIALVEPDYKTFSEDELKLCDYIISQFCGVGGTESSEWSHKRLGWLFTTDREEIPYFTIYMWEKEPITQADIEWARTRLGKHQ